MAMDETGHKTLENQDESQKVETKRLVFMYLHQAPWFILCILIALASAYVINRYATKIYHTSAQIKIRNPEQRGVNISGLVGSRNAAPLFRAVQGNLLDEIAIAKSRRLLDTVVTKLDLRTLFYREGDINTVEVWKNYVPFQVHWLNISAGSSSPTLTIDFTSPTQFSISHDDEVLLKGASLYDTVKVGKRLFTITLNPSFPNAGKNLDGQHYLFHLSATESAVNKLRGRIAITQTEDKSTILTVGYNGPLSAKNEAIVNTLISVFNQDGIRDRQRISKRTEKFLDQRLVLLERELDTAERGLVNYKNQKGFVTIQTKINTLLAERSSARKSIINKQIQIKMAEGFRDEIKNGKEYTLLPANIGLNNGTINSLTGRYNSAVNELSKRKVSSTENNPEVQRLKEQMDLLKSNLLGSLNSYLQSLKISLQNSKERYNTSAGSLQQMPRKGKGLQSISRQTGVKEKIYLFLLQKREEAALKYATTLATIKVVDYAYTSRAPIAPKTTNTYLIALFIGLLGPFLFFYLKFLFDTKIHNKEDIERELPNMAITGEVPWVSGDSYRLIENNDRSVLAEAFRIMRTNLTFYNQQEGAQEQGKVIFVTSSTKGEGKTFITMNLGNTLASTGKKTLIIGGDLRNPQTHKYYGIDKNDLGASAYLSDYSVKFEDMIIHGPGNFENLDLLIAGQIPPNPAELLLSARFGELLKEARSHYDYVIVDTAPTLLVTDTLLISDYADLTLYATRAEHTEVQLLQHIKNLNQEGKLKRMSIVVNGIKPSSSYGYSYAYGYGYNYNYGYGYGYGAQKAKRWWNFWKK